MTNQLPPIAAPSVQLVHMDGPLKGRLDELPHDRITLGRDASCHVILSADARMVSRMHAEIVREGVRFMLVNLGRNGSLVNGKPADRVYLKPGDIIQLAEGGPKLSFLTAAATKNARPTASAGPAPVARPSAANPIPTPRPTTAMPRPDSTPAPSWSPPPVRTPSPTPGNNRGTQAPPAVVSFTLQFGTHIKTFKKANVTLGREDDTDFPIKHPSVHKRQAELYATGSQFGIRDLSGTRETYVNKRVISADTILNDNDIIMLGDQGPQLRHLGGGRFVEVIEQGSGKENSHSAPPTEIETHKAFQEEDKSNSGFFKGFFKR